MADAAKLAIGAIAVAIGLVAPAWGQDAPGARATFLQAADTGDVAAMRPLVKRDVLKMLGGRMSPSDFFKRIEGCYLRRVYGNEAEPADVLAAWMCQLDKGNTRSRVVMVKIGQEKGEVLLWDFAETTNERPAPPRAGSAFAKE